MITSKYKTYPASLSTRLTEGGLRLTNLIKNGNEGFPLISIITVSYNEENNIENTINSVINQSYTNIEYIIVDGGSTDKTINIIKKYEYHIDYYISEKDDGIYDAMNKGIALSNGKYLFFLNSGDSIVDGDTIKFMVENMNHKSPSILYGKVILRSSEGEALGENLKELSDDNILIGYPIPHQSTLFPAEFFNSIGYYDINYSLAADYEWCLKAKIKRLPFTKIDRQIANFQVGGTHSKLSDLLNLQYIFILSNHNIISLHEASSSRFAKFLDQIKKDKLRTLLQQVKPPLDNIDAILRILKRPSIKKLTLRITSLMPDKLKHYLKKILR